MFLIGGKCYIFKKIINIFKIIPLFFIITSLLFSQDLIEETKLVKVDSIKISGNERTKDFVILRELTFGVGDSVNNETLFLNRERIFSLGIFTKINLKFKQKNGINSVVILVEESWYIFPVPFIMVREKTLKRTSYGISLKYKNFRGRNETIRATASLGYDPFYSLEYENPLLIPSEEIAFYFAGAYGTPVNKSPTLEVQNGSEFDFNVISINTTWGKRINKENNFYISLGYSDIKAPTEVINSYMASGTSSDKTISTGLAYVYDSRDLRQYARAGQYLALNYLHNGLGSSEISYNTISFDARNYREIYKSLLVKGQVNARHTFGNYVPYYNYSRLGYGYYTRGNRYIVREGNNRLLGSLEIAYPVLSEWNFSTDLPILPNSLTRTRIAVHAGFFIDAATVFDNGDKILLNNFDSGYGFGLTFLFLPYSSFRVEYAFNEMGKGELLIETGISF